MQIFESFLVSATNTDLLSLGRLNSIPFRGMLVLRFQSDLGTAAANYSLTLQLPDGEVPVDGQQIPAASGAAVIGVMDIRTMLQFQYPILNTGGHFVVSLTETGAAVAYVQAILTSR